MPPVNCETGTERELDLLKMNQLAPLRSKEPHSSNSQNYIPEESILEDGIAIQHGKKLKYRPGLNFSAHDRLTVQINGQDPIGSKVSTFQDLNLDPKVTENVRSVGHKKPTLVQKNMIPYINLEMDVLACAGTGLGKTAAYLLPIVSKLVQDTKEERTLPRCLILVPTRELAMQVNTEANVYSCGTGLRVRLLCGGVAIWYQKEAMKRGLDILVSTPGRLIHFIREHNVDLSSVKYFVLDEVDRMLDMGFMNQVRSIMRSLPPMVKRVNIMCSATLPSKVQLTAADYLRDGHIFIAIGTVSGASSSIEQTIYKVERTDKRRKVTEILGNIEDCYEKILIFCSRRIHADTLAAYLNNSLQFPTTWIHAKRSQKERDAALKEFVEGEKQVLVASDVAARGLDIPKVATVINYDLPQSIEEYVQRIGRTGRAGHIGKAISFFEVDQDDHLRAKLGSILHDAGQSVPDWLLEPEVAADSDIQLGYTAEYRQLSVRWRRQCVPLPIEPPDEIW